MREVWGFRVFWARSDCEGVRASLPSMKPFYTPRADSLQVVKPNSTVSLDEGSVRVFFFFLRFISEYQLNGIESFLPHDTCPNSFKQAEVTHIV